MTDPGEPPYVLPPAASQTPPGYAPPPGAYPPLPGYGYGPPPPGYAGYPYGGAPYGWDGPPGKIRPTGISILLFFCTLGIYMFVYNYSVHFEMKRHSGRGIGGGVALLLSFLAYIAMPFVTAAEVGSLYARRGQPQPVNGWTGLWATLPLFAGYIMQFVIVFALFNNDAAVIVVALVAIWISVVVAGAMTWFFKTNEALNNYWYSVGVRGEGRYV